MSGCKESELVPPMTSQTTEFMEIHFSPACFRVGDITPIQSKNPKSFHGEPSVRAGRIVFTNGNDVSGQVLETISVYPAIARGRLVLGGHSPT